MKERNKKNKAPAERLYFPSFAELLDQLTVDQIKEVLKPANRKSCAEEIKKISHDLDNIIAAGKIKLSARILRIVIVLAQMNLHIWHLKDRMNEDPKKYAGHLRLAHQLNGLRNQMKNLLLEEIGSKEKSSRKTNFNTDGLKGWNISF